MKLIVALALSVNAFTPSTPGGAKPREKSFLRHRPRIATPSSWRRDGRIHGVEDDAKIHGAEFTRRKILISTQVTLTDCCATTSAEGQAGATGGTFGMFSDPMTADDFVAKL